MIFDIYKTLIRNGFTSKNQDVKNNKRLGIKNSFSNKNGHYVEIYVEDWGFDIFIYGNGFMNGYYPSCFSILNKNDIMELDNKIRNVLNSNSN